MEQENSQVAKQDQGALTEAEMNIIRQTLKELKGAGKVWDVLSQERITYRTSEELRALYYQQGYGASGSGQWRKNGEKPNMMGELPSDCWTIHSHSSL